MTSQTAADLKESVVGTPPTAGRSARPSARSLTPLAMCLLVVAAGALFVPGFFVVDNLRSVVQASAFVGLVAIGMTLIMISGNVFSLSLGTTVALSASTFLYTLQWGLAAALIAAVLLGAVIGWMQGILIGSLNANPIIVTIAASSLQIGLYLKITGGASVLPGADKSVFAFLNGRLLGIPLGFVAFLVLVAIVDVGLRTTAFGANIRQLGENRLAAKFAGFRVARITGGVFAIAGVCAGLAGIFVGAFNESATLSISGTYTFDAIAATLVGGTLVMGGRGSAARTLVGALLISALTSILLLEGLSRGWQLLLKGVVVLLVVCVIQISDRRART